MAQTIPYQVPRLIDSGPTTASDYSYTYLPMAGGQSANEGDFLTVASGVMSRAATNAAGTTLAGLSMFASAQIYHAFANAGVGLNFGPDQSGTPLIPGTNQSQGVVQFAAGLRMEMSLSTATVLAQSVVGTQVGVSLDATTNFYYADPSQSNKIGIVVALPGGPDAPVGRNGISNGVIGDSGGRVIVELLSSIAWPL